MKARRIVTILLSYIFLAALILAAFSPLAVRRGQAVDTPAETAVTKPVISLGTPKVEFAAGSFPEDATELTLVVQAQEVPLLSRFAALKTADLSGSSCYEEILAWAAEHPAVSLRYTVELPNGSQVDNSATQVDLGGLTDADAAAAAALLQYLPQLSAIELGSTSLSGESLAAIRQAAPEASLSGTLNLLGQEVSLAAESLDLSSLSHEDAASVAQALGCLGNVKSIALGSSENGLSWEDIGLIEAACPDAAVDYRFQLWGKDVNLSDEMLDLNHIAMDDQGAAVRAVLPYMTKCKVLDMDSCGVSNESMAVIRDENPDVDVVWRVNFGSDYSVRTNVTKILASKPSKGGILYDDVGSQLQYCTKVRYLDLGHNTDVEDFGFVRYMPDLEIAVISMTAISDLTPFASCSNLKYLEAGNTSISDLSPLANCTALRHLNVGTCFNVSDISPLYDLDLKRLWIGIGDPVPKEQIEKMRELHPDCEVNDTVPTGLEKDANGNQNNEGYVTGNWKCYQQYLKADWDYFAQNHVFPAQRPIGWFKVVYKAFQYNLGDGCYSFSWNDPKFNAHDPSVAPVNTHVLDTSFLDEDFEIPETIIPDKLEDPPGELLYESSY